MFSEFDIEMMTIAMDEAKLAESKGEVPVGAVISNNNKIVSQAHNLSIKLNDPSGHAEILALRKASEKQQNYRIPKSTLYVTLEPCIMCYGAMINARIERLVIGALDDKNGVPVSNNNFLTELNLNHKIKAEFGLMQENAGFILKNFFIKKRIK